MNETGGALGRYKDVRRQRTCCDDGASSGEGLRKRVDSDTVVGVVADGPGRDQRRITTRLEGVEVPGHSFALQLAPGVLDARAAVSGDGFEFGFGCGDAVGQSSELPGQAGEGALFVPCQ